MLYFGNSNLMYAVCMTVQERRLIFIWARIDQEFSNGEIWAQPTMASQASFAPWSLTGKFEDPAARVLLIVAVFLEYFPLSVLEIEYETIGITSRYPVGTGIGLILWNTMPIRNSTTECR